MNIEDMEKRLQSLETRLQATEDLEAIKQLHYKYMDGMTQTRWDEVLDCFAEDATIDITPSGQVIGKGIAEIRRQYNNLAKVHIGKDIDFAIHPRISVNGNKAKGKWLMYLGMYKINDAKQQEWVMNQGVYNAEYVKINGQWKFSFLQHRPRRIEPVDEFRHPEP
ncbi:MAG: nuclear transport factor 2 family protein [Desulfobacteraceae bacterium]|nr:MAG: nuclear transport factor 2 family protein [Desulfobacteraceae bacterium]